MSRVLLVDPTDNPDVKELIANSISEFKSSKTHKRLVTELFNIESMTNPHNPEYTLRDIGAETTPTSGVKYLPLSNMEYILDHINSNLIVSIGQ